MSLAELKTNSREFVTFEIAEMGYCIDIVSVREIRGWSATTPLPHAPEYFIGVINLRGSVLPVIDLACRLGMEKTEPSDRHAIIVLQIGERTIGWLVDAVADIIEVTEEDIEQVPSSASDKARSYVSGIVTVNENMIRILGVDAIVPGEEMPSV